MTHQLDLTGRVARYCTDATTQSTLDQYSPQTELADYDDDRA